MLSIQNSTNAAWRTSFLQILPKGTDLDNESEIRQAFILAVAWAKTQEPPFTHKRSAAHYTEQYLRTLKDGSPVIPKVMRAYCAAKLNLNVVVDDVEEKPQFARTSAATRRAVTPPRQNAMFIRA